MSVADFKTKYDALIDNVANRENYTVRVVYNITNDSNGDDLIEKLIMFLHEVNYGAYTTYTEKNVALSFLSTTTFKNALYNAYLKNVFATTHAVVAPTDTNIATAWTAVNPAPSNGTGGQSGTGNSNDPGSIPIPGGGIPIVV